MSRSRTAALLATALLAAAACSQSSSRMPAGVSAANHAFFPVAAGDHVADCASCHTDAATFAVFSCTGCHAHDQAPIDLVHGSVASYAYASGACLRCHAAPARGQFDHAGITGGCAQCHDAGQSFARLPTVSSSHLPTNGADCSGCHGKANWTSAQGPAALVRDPTQDVAVIGLIPSYAGTSIVAVTPNPQALPMAMSHATSAVDAATLGNCAACHAMAGAGSFYPGTLHAALANQGAPEPVTCGDCHAGAAPIGFVGASPTHPARTPASGEMKHDAVAWTNGAPGTTPLVVADCGVCHPSPGAFGGSWATPRPGAAQPLFHASLGAAALAQPATCLDCHASSRPVTVLTSSGAALPAGVALDHAAQEVLGECATCHAASAAASGWAAWAGGRFHPAGAATPASCLPCHAGERPTSAAGWKSTTYAASPFDYGTNAAGVTHGDGRDCALCHAGPGTGAWGGTQNWIGGSFDHGPATVAASTCIACHASQRPDLLPGTTASAMASLLGFDHSVNGTGDCLGCHEATTRAGRYRTYLDPSAPAKGSSDWAGGSGYPGAALVAAPDSAWAISELTLLRTGTRVTGMATMTATLYGGMSHVSSAIPAAMSPGPANAPDGTTCWHCHTNSNGTVTSYANGTFHPSLSSYAAAPGGTVTPFSQPTSGCGDCHGAMRPTGIVELAGSSLQPMDHSALFTSAVTIGGATVTGAAGLDCSACHASPGGTWADGVFHARIGTAQPADCTVCHYPLMASTAADVTSGTRYGMAHRSSLVTVQRCDACHATALSSATATPAASTLWQGGAYHGRVAAQPGACLDCHAVTVPAAPTQSTVAYVFTAGGTATNGGQWMSHAAIGVMGADCAGCHAADAKASGAAWNRSTGYHAVVAQPATCQACHGLGNGNGGAAGTGNNLPVGLTDASTLTSASNDAATGVPAGTHDQITHADVNVTGHDCSFCHTQVGPSTAAGVQGHEWAQARFHASFATGAPLVMNGTTGRCSACHMNVRPGATFTAQDHSAFTSASGTQDCNSCHAWPGTGTAAAPNWLGGGAAPQYITVGGFTIPSPPASTPVTQAGIASLPHPGTATNGCSTCHTGGAGGKRAIGYDHAATTLIGRSCSACHEAGSNLVGTAWNGATSVSAGAGDTRPITLATVSAKGDPETYPNHFYADPKVGAQVDCGWCHVAPAGVAIATTGTAYRTAWAFKHPPESPAQNFCYQCHAGGIPN